eukprot:TRINITY_DN967_c0_g2_i1.p1 TRINITY_DN967_c0_g2~~TRINITY_DN967_c0_g2_i1.p1  ORF type:complete len:455 (+),score=158.08 TRINITY_DN967_c0_g2_i1:30-1394(+)
MSLFYYGAAAVAGLAVTLIFLERNRKRARHGLKVAQVKQPLRLINYIARVLSIVGLNPFRLKKAYLVQRAKEVAAMGDKEIFGDQSELVRGVEAFMNSVEEEKMSASGVFLINGLFERILNARASVVKYIQDNRTVVLESHVKKPLIITGLPRTGSTMLYNLCACDPEGRAPRFFEISHMALPAPPTTEQSRDTDPRIAQVMGRFDEIERMYPDMFKEAGKSHRSHPNELEEELLVLFQGIILQLHVILAPTEYRDWFDAEDKRAAYRYLQLFVQMMNSTWEPHHWVLKAPVHALYLDSLVEAFPDARLVFTHRNPKNVVPSFSRLIASYVQWDFGDEMLDLHDLGQYQLETMKKMSDRMVAFQERTDPSKYFNVNYSEFVKDPVAMVEQIYGHFEMPVTEQFKENMREWIRENRQGKYGRAGYTAEEFGLTNAQIMDTLAEYVERFCPDAAAK